MIEVTIDKDHIIEAIISQRNAALDEVARQAAIIRALTAELKAANRESPGSPAEEPKPA